MGKVGRKLLELLGQLMVLLACVGIAALLVECVVHIFWR